jgi:hypothetical protein
VGDAFVEVLADAFHGLVVFEVSAEDGFNELGRIRTTAEDAMYYDVPAFTRGVFIGDFVYAVSDRGVRAALIDLAEEIVGQVDFPRAFDFPIPVDGDFAIANEPAMGGVER